MPAKEKKDYKNSIIVACTWEEVVGPRSWPRERSQSSMIHKIINKVLFYPG